MNGIKHSNRQIKRIIVDCREISGLDQPSKALNNSFGSIARILDTLPSLQPSLESSISNCLQKPVSPNEYSKSIENNRKNKQYKNQLLS